MKAYKFKIKHPTKAIIQKFEQTLHLCRELYNAALQERRDAWRLNRISIDYFDQANQLKDIRKSREDCSEVYSQVLQDVLKRLDKTFKAFFRRVKKGEKTGFPRFKGKNFFDSFCFPQMGFKLNGDKLTLSKIGEVRIRLSRKMMGKVKTCTIKREISGWFVIFTVETQKFLLEKTGKSVGIDAGVENFMTLSDGTQIENQKYFESSQKQIRRANRSVSRKKKGSKNRKKVVLKLKKIHQKIKNRRFDFQHKVSTFLIKSFDTIAIEKLNILGMSKGILSKQIHDASWSKFFGMLRYKAENADKQLIEVSPNYTSQTCLCGHREKKTLSQRWHYCSICGLSIHRDICSAKLILERAVGQTVETLTYVATQCVVSESSSLTDLV